MGNDPTVGRSGLGGLPGPDRSFRNGRSILIRANTRVGKGALCRLRMREQNGARTVPTHTRDGGLGARYLARADRADRRALAHPTVTS